MLTGRNHTHVGSGTIAERAVAFDGYTGIIPKEAATMAEVLNAFTASETFDVGIDLGSPVSLYYGARRPFEFNSKINTMSVQLDNR